MLAGRRAVDLPEPLEDVGQLPCGDSDSVVLDADEISLRIAFHADNDPAMPAGELDRVGEQVPQDLLEPEGIGADQRHRGRRRREDDGDQAPVRHHPDRVDRALDDVGERHRLAVERQGAAIHSREIEQVVDEREQNARGLANLGKSLSQRILVEAFLHEEIRPAHDRRQRRAELVVDVLKEVVLQAAGAAQLLDRAGERRIETDVLQEKGSDVRERRDRVHFLAPEASGTVDRDDDPDRFPVRLQGSEQRIAAAEHLFHFEVDVGLPFEIVGVVGVAALVDRGRDRARIDGDLHLGGELLGEVPPGPGALEAVGVRIVEEEQDGLRARERSDRFARAGQDLLHVGRAVAGARQVMQAPLRFDAARDAFSHSVDGGREASELVR